jgi:signal transduction histidine kinase
MTMPLGWISGGPAADRAMAAREREPAFAIQLNALQALCRQVFGFRLAMIAISSPVALVNTAHGPATWLVGSAVVVTFMGSYLLFRDWERFGPLLLRHPALLAVDMLFGAFLLVTATPVSPLGYVTVCTPLLAGLAYDWRGAALFAVLQAGIISFVYAALPGLETRFSNSLLLPGLCIVAGAIGVSLRNLMLRFGAASHALTETRARLAVTEAVHDERSRLAREMHDSVVKTLHGLALAADGLAASADRAAPETIRDQAGLVARAARRAAAESRELLADLRRESGMDGTGIQIPDELAAQVADFSRRTGVAADFQVTGGEPVPLIPHPVARQLLTIASEALENAQRHAKATHVRGLPPGTNLDDLRKAGHFGLIGMVERAAGIGSRIRIGKGRATRGTEVRLDLPAAAILPRDPADHTHPPAPPGPG